MHLPGHLYGVDLAVHPTEGWPAVIALSRFVASTDPMQVFARVYNPHTRTWNVAQQVDVGTSSAGQDRFGGAQIGISGDGAVHAVWGSSDEDGGIWTSASSDYGLTWSAPQRIAQCCWQPLDVATTTDNQIAVLLSCWGGTPGIVLRRGDGTWLPMERPGTRGQFGAIRIVGEGDEARIVAVMTELQDTRQVDILTRRVAGNDGWQLTARRVTPPAGLSPALLWQQRAVLFAPDGSATTGIAVVWPGFESGAAYALVSRDSGATWGAVEAIVAAPEVRINRVVAAYDPAANRLVAIWTCCGKPAFESTHYASWGVPGSGQWQPSSVSDAIPLVLGARAADDMASDQARNSRTVWLAWAEAEHQLEVRSFDLNKTVPVDQYPQPTTTPTQTEAGGQLFLSREKGLSRTLRAGRLRTSVLYS